MRRGSTIARRALVVATALALSARAARAADYVVGPGGGDDASGAAGHPWRTIQRACREVKPGDTVTVEDGSYAGFACEGVSGTADARIVFRARHRGAARITRPTEDGGRQARRDDVQLEACSFVTVDGFEVSGAPRSGIAILGDTADGHDARGVIIRGCNVHDNGGGSSRGRHDGIFSGFALDLTIEDNRVDVTGEHGIYVSNAADNPAILRNQISNTGVNGIQINADASTGGDGVITGWRIEGNVIRNCKGSAAINLDGAVRGVARNNVVFGAAKAGITLFREDGAESSHGNVIVNNTVYDPAGTRAALQIADGADGNIVFNNILISRGPGLQVLGASGLVHDYNLVSSFAGAKMAPHETSPRVASLFVAPDAGDLRLAAASPAVDAGAAALGGRAAPATDVANAIRPAGAGYDVGAYERDATRAAAPAAPAAPGALRSAAAFTNIADRQGRAAALFLEASRVFLHPRCVNCHPDGDAPHQGMTSAAHDPPVARGPDDRGVAGLRCGGCHQDRALELARVPGAPGWRLAPRAMAWAGRSPRAICEQMKDPARNGGRTLAQLVLHNAHDALVAWAWSPGAGREPAPGTQAQLGELVAAWVAAGAACPAEGRAGAGL